MRSPTSTICALVAACCTATCTDAERAPPGAPDVTGGDGDAGDRSEVDASSPAPPRCELPEGALVTLPADDARHHAPAEWFYWTGHLAAADGRRFGLHVTVLVSGPPGMGIAIAHHSLTEAPRDGGHGRYRHAVEFGLDDRSPERGFDFEVGGVAARGHDGVDRLVSSLDGSRLELAVVDERGPVARHGVGYKVYAEGISTWYYARPRMTARGTLALGDERVAVSGDVWFDHQWGALAPATASRWDWLGVSLDDGREIMVTRFPLGGGDSWGEAEVTRRDCTTAVHEGADVALVSHGLWTSPTTGCVYPAGWTLRVGEESFTIDPLVADQEVRADPIGYWEGAAAVGGDATGRAYVELVGYCGGPGR
ncbi:MAG: hypothetical protein IT385_00710 [Deltaproteobacteria bacterium]|nr:hypothetical protein [Deltaproteobacteria bacterium]